MILERKQEFASEGKCILTATSVLWGPKLRAWDVHVQTATPSVPQATRDNVPGLSRSYRFHRLFKFGNVDTIALATAPHQFHRHGVGKRTILVVHKHVSCNV